MPELAAAKGEPEEPGRVLEDYGPLLLAAAATSIEYGLHHGKPLHVTASEYPEALRSPMASFVTLECEGGLRGCVGSAEAYRPLIEDVAANAFAAAFRDTRFPPLVAAERDRLDISVSLLAPALPIAFADEDELLEQLRPGVDGLILESGRRRALFLPQVWTLLPAPGAFVTQLKRKAGIDDDIEPGKMKAWRFRAYSFSSASLPDRGALWR